MKFEDITVPKYENGDKVECEVGLYNRKQIGRIGAVKIFYNDIGEQDTSYIIIWKNFYTDEEDDAEVSESKILRLIKEGE